MAGTAVTLAADNSREVVQVHRLFLDVFRVACQVGVGVATPNGRRAFRETVVLLIGAHKFRIFVKDLIANFDLSLNQ